MNISGDEAIDTSRFNVINLWLRIVAGVFTRNSDR